MKQLIKTLFIIISMTAGLLLLLTYLDQGVATEKLSTKPMSNTTEVTMVTNDAVIVTCRFYYEVKGDDFNPTEEVEYYCLTMLTHTTQLAGHGISFLDIVKNPNEIEEKIISAFYEDRQYAPVSKNNFRINNVEFVL